MEWKWNGNGMEMEWKWNGNEMEMEWNMEKLSSIPYPVNGTVVFLTKKNCRATKRNGSKKPSLDCPWLSKNVGFFWIVNFFLF